MKPAMHPSVPEMHTTTDMNHGIAGLRRQLRTTQAIGLLLVTAFGITCLLGLQSATTPAAPAAGLKDPVRFGEITVERINVAGPDGVRRFIISHDAPKALFAGQEWERTVPPGMASLIILDPSGHEVGGYAASEAHTMLSLDYRNHPLEAAVIGTGIAPDGSQAATFVLKQPPAGPTVDLHAVVRGFEKYKKGAADPNDPDVREFQRHLSMQSTRVELFTTATMAGVSVNDSKGRQRIVLQVDESDNPAVIVYDAEGKETLRIPEAPRDPK